MVFRMFWWFVPMLLAGQTKNFLEYSQKVIEDSTGGIHQNKEAGITQDDIHIIIMFERLDHFFCKESPIFLSSRLHDKFWMVEEWCGQREFKV